MEAGPVSVSPPLWLDRQDAGVALGRRLADRGPLPADAWLLGLPRGGVPVAAAMAAVLDRPVRSWSVRKIADPAWPELAIGAVAAGGVTVWRPEDGASGEARARRLGWLQRQEAELQRRQRLYGDPDPNELAGRHLIVVDDGIATGMTVQAALLSLGRLDPASLILAVPVLDRTVVATLAPLCDGLEALAVVDHLRSVGEWYQRFEQVEDGDVLALLADRPLRPDPGSRSGLSADRPPRR
jgi:putative phosphoribosyl transferase